MIKDMENEPCIQLTNGNLIKEIRSAQAHSETSRSIFFTYVQHFLKKECHVNMGLFRNSEGSTVCLVFGTNSNFVFHFGSLIISVSVQ